MTNPKQNTGLQIIFSIFLGLMVVAFIGVGVYTFYAPPESRYDKQIQEISRKMESIQSFKDPSTLTPAQQAELRKLQDEMNALNDKQAAEREVWGRNTSIILITFATLVMAISLIRAEQLPVISNGLLLGGVFTMIYGVGWIIATGSSYARFAVMSVALVITLGLGWLRFVRVRQAQAEAGTGAAIAVDNAAVGDLATRVAALEARVDAAASALGEKRSG
jgi:uncharacterized protein HemX